MKSKTKKNSQNIFNSFYLSDIKCHLSIASPTSCASPPSDALSITSFDCSDDKINSESAIVVLVLKKK